PAANSRLTVEEAVADATDRVDEGRTPELLAQLGDVHVDGARSTGERESPDAIEEPVTRHDVAGVARELCEQLELERPQCERRACECRATRSEINPQLAHLDDPRLRWPGLCPSQDRADTRHELARREGLGEVVVSSELEADDAVRFIVARGQDQDRDVRGVAQPSTEIEPVDVRKPEVEHDEARVTSIDRFEAALAGAFTHHLEAGLLQVRAYERTDRFVVFDDDREAAHRRIARIAVARRPTWSTATTSPSRR